jgi:hypothetical protein
LPCVKELFKNVKSKTKKLFNQMHTCCSDLAVEVGQNWPRDRQCSATWLMAVRLQQQQQ